MDTLSYKTVSANRKTVDKQWLLVDAEGETLGRMASKVAKMLRGKHKPNFTPHVDCGDNVIVINSEKVIRYPVINGKIRCTSAIRAIRADSDRKRPEKYWPSIPQRIVEKAIKGMLPKNKLGAELFRNLKVVIGTEHNHEAQKPTVVNLKEFK